MNRAEHDSYFISFIVKFKLGQAHTAQRPRSADMKNVSGGA